MIFKERKESSILKGVKFFVAAELGLFCSSYLLYAACNRSQETRKYFHDSSYLKFVLEFYYKVGEKFGTDTVRAYDRAVWAAQKGEQTARGA